MRSIGKFAGDLCRWFDGQLRQMFDETEGGRIRSLKGGLVEKMADRIIGFAWRRVGGESQSLCIGRKMYLLPAPDGRGQGYRISLDRQVYVGEMRPENLVVCVECKAYAEVAMYKRVLLDCKIMKEAVRQIAPDRADKIRLCLLVLESQLGGDFSREIIPCLKSPPVAAIDLLFPDVSLEVVVLMDGERRVDKPIHKEEFKKRLNPKRVARAVGYFERLFRLWLKKDGAV